MDDIFELLKKEASRLASELPAPAFYKDLAAQADYSHELFFDHPLPLRMQEDVIPFLYDNFGHGVEHSKKVALDAATIILYEGGTIEQNKIRHLALMGQLAGLMHDIQRMEDDHAQKAGETAFMILRDYPLSDNEKAMIARAVAEHEAFTDYKPDPDDIEQNLLSGALYDADKFRWGPDNFCTTLWEICDHENWSLNEIYARFPYGLEIIESILPTFRTEAGKKYGPEMIDMGLKIGKKIYKRLGELVAEQCRWPKSENS